MKKTADSIKNEDRFRDRETGKIYVVKAVERNEVLLVGENGLGRRLTGVDNLKKTCEKLEGTEGGEGVLPK